MARTRSSEGEEASPSTSKPPVKTKPQRKPPAARKPISSASKVTARRPSRGKPAEEEGEGSEQERVEVKEETEGEETEVKEPPRKRRKAAILVKHPERAQETLAEDRKTSDASRRMHIGKKYSPGNGQMDYTLSELVASASVLC